MNPAMIYTLLNALEGMGAHYSLSRHRSDTIMVSVTLVGKRIEIDVFEDNHVEYSIFAGDESVLSDIDALFAMIRDDM